LIAAIRVAVEIWAWGIPVAGVALGVLIAKASPLNRRYMQRNHYAFWCVAWPAALAVLVFRTLRAWWHR
jgi:hypothetical protein